MDARIKEILDSVLVKNIILDFSCINFIDSMGVNAILQVRIFSNIILVNLKLIIINKINKIVSRFVLVANHFVLVTSSF